MSLSEKSHEITFHITTYMQSISNISAKDAIATGMLFDVVSVGGLKKESKISKHIADLLDAHAVYHLKSAYHDIRKGREDEILTEADMSELRPLLGSLKNKIQLIEGRRG